MGCAGFGRSMGHGVGLPSSFLGWPHRDAVSVLTDRGRYSVRVLLRILAECYGS
jgi:hypothetical protein